MTALALLATLILRAPARDTLAGGVTYAQPPVKVCVGEWRQSPIWRTYGYRADLWPRINMEASEFVYNVRCRWMVPGTREAVTVPPGVYRSWTEVNGVRSEYSAWRRIP